MRRRARQRLSTVRVRTALGAGLVVALALVAGAGALVGILRHTMISSVDGHIALRADDVAAAAVVGDLPSRLAGGLDDDAVAQVVDRAGRVVAQSRGIRGTAPIASVAGVGPRDRITTVHHAPIGDGGAFRVLARRVEGPSGSRVLLVGGSLEPMRDSVNAVLTVLAFGIPSLVLLVALLAWLLVGRTLRPVERMRREVDAISDRALDRRVPEPRTADEIARLARTMNRMLDRLEASRVRERRFVADAAHELRSPLTNVRAQLDVAGAHPDVTDWPALTEALRGQHERIEALVENLLVLARADEGRLGLARAPIDLDDVVLREAATIRARRRVALDLSGLSGARVVGDAADLGRAVQNLLDNAERHATSTAWVEVGEVAGAVQLAVEDDGPGIAPADRERAFERFTRLDDARSRAGGGAGLGLAIVDEIVKAHHGTIRITDPVHGSHGARVEISLPASPRTPATATPIVAVR